jgi:hypothetical protein
MNALASTLPGEKPEYFPTVRAAESYFQGVWPRIRHELRVLLPWAFGIILCELMTLAFRDLDSHKQTKPIYYTLVAVGIFGVGLLPVCIAALSLQSFASEFHDATLPQLIVQPISRLRLWLEKLAVAATLLGISCGFGLVLFSTLLVMDQAPDTKREDMACLAGLTLLGILSLIPIGVLLLGLRRLVSPWLLALIVFLAAILAVPRLFEWVRPSDAGSEVLVLLAVAAVLFTYLAGVLLMAPLIVMITRRALPALLSMLGYILVSCFLVIQLFRLFEPLRIEQAVAFWITIMSVLLLSTVLTGLAAYNKLVRLEV